MSGIALNWVPPGPLSVQWMKHRGPVNVLNGPIGSGKTTTNFVFHILQATSANPSPRDGLRRYKLTVVRDTYRNLWRSTIPSWWKLVPQQAGEWVGARDNPAQHKVYLPCRDGGRAELVMDFVAIGDQAVEDVMRGYEPTAFMIDELDLVAKEVLEYAGGRAGRYPSMADGGPAWYGVTAAMNAPVIGSWAYDTMYEALPESWGFVRLPSGRSPQAENTANLPPAYYERQMQGRSQNYIRRMIDNIPGYPEGGKPIFPEFNDQIHVPAQDIEPVRGLKLILGIDAGGTPALTVRQNMPNGQRRVLDELVTRATEVTGARRFGEMIARLLAQRYAGWDPKLIEGGADPAAQYGADKAAGERDWIQIVSHHSGVRFRPAPTNRLLPRFEAIRRPMSTLIDGNTPGFMVSPRCRMLRGAYNGGYRYRKAASAAGGDLYAEEPEKNEYSHIAEADQYAALVDGEYLEVMGRNEARRSAAIGQMRAIDDEFPQGVYRDGPGRAGGGPRFGRFAGD